LRNLREKIKACPHVAAEGRKKRLISGAVLVGGWEITSKMARLEGKKSKEPSGAEGGGENGSCNFSKRGC